jgi:hypothetical protein
MQCCTRHLISKVIRIPIVGHYNYYTNATINKMDMQEQQDNGLISPEWEEAIIKEQRIPDVPLDLMQKETIDQIHNNNYNHANYNKQQSNLNTMKTSSIDFMLYI